MNGFQHITLKSGLLFLLALGIFVGGCQPPNDAELWREIDVPGGLLRIEYAPPPAYGSHTLYFSYLPKEGKEVISLGQRELNNDGANLGNHNLEELARTDSSLTIVLHGQQQADEVLLLLLQDGEVSLSTN
jgi:hypothetical protein